MGLLRTIDMVLTDEIEDGAILDVNVAAGANIAVAKLSIDLTNVMLGIAAGYAVTRGSVVVTGTEAVVTGLTAIVAAVALPRADLIDTDEWISCTWAVGTLTLKMWKPTVIDGGATCNATPIEATVGLQVDWIAVGTL